MKSFFRFCWFFVMGLILTVTDYFTKPVDLIVEQIILQKTPSQHQDSSREEKVRVVMLTDFHYGAEPFEKINDDILQRVVNQTNALKPDIIALLGDYVDHKADPMSNLCTQWLSKLQAKHAIIAVLGNHDYKDRKHEFIKKELESIGIKVLSNEQYFPITELPHFEVIGVGDISQGFPEFNPEKAFEKTKPDTYKLLLSHNPKTISNFTKWNVDLQISGHLHGGQIRTPSGYPVLGWFRYILDLWPSLFGKVVPRQAKHSNNWKQASGLHYICREDFRNADVADLSVTNLTREGYNMLYVSKGLGTHYIRTFCPLEISSIDIYL